MRRVWGKEAIRGIDVQFLRENKSGDWSSLYTWLLIFWFCFSGEKFLLHNTSQPGRYHIEETGLQIMIILPPQVMGRDACSTTPTSYIKYKGVEQRNQKNPHMKNREIFQKIEKLEMPSLAYHILFTHLKYHSYHHKQGSIVICELFFLTERTEMNSNSAIAKLQIGSLSSWLFSLLSWMTAEQKYAMKQL